MPDDQNTFANLQAKVLELQDSLDELQFIVNKKTGPSSQTIGGSNISSINFVSGSSGWQLTADGNIEANNGNFRGDITGATGTFSGTVNINSLNIPDSTTANSMHVDSLGNTWWGTNVATGSATAPASILKDGTAKFGSITATGTINATGGYLGASSSVINVGGAGLDIGTSGYVKGGQTDFNTNVGFFLGYSSAAYKFSIGDPAGQRVTWDGSTLSVVGSQNISKYFTADEAITAGDAVVISDGTIIFTAFDNGLSGGDVVSIGTTNNFGPKLAVKFTFGSTTLTVTKIKLSLSKNGAPSDNLIIALQADSAGLPSGSDITTITVAAGTLTGSQATYELTFSSPQTFTASTQYWIELRRSGSNDNANNYNAYGTTGTGADYGNQSGSYVQISNHQTWVLLERVSTAGNLLRSSANTTGRFNSFVGFASASIALFASGAVIVSGVITGLSGLTAGSFYYLNNSSGTIGTSAGANTRKAGMALSTTELLITNIW